MGTVKIALKDLLAQKKGDAQGLQPEIAGWFTVSNDSNISSASLEDIMDVKKQSADSFEDKDDASSNQMQVYLRMQLDIRNASTQGAKHANEGHNCSFALLLLSLTPLL